MSQDTRQTRRQILKLTGSAAAIGLAGCASLGSQTSDGDDGNEENHQEETNHDDEETNHNDEGDHHDEEETNHNDEETNHNDEGDHHDEEETNHDDEETNHDDEETNHDEEGGDDHGHNHDEGIPEEPSASAEVSLTTSDGEHHFAPHITWVEQGGTVTWTLESGSHDVVAYHPDSGKPRRMPEAAEPWSSDLLSESGATVEHTFETEGVYDYYCTPHEAVGMVGTVIVGKPDPHEQSALAEPQDSLPDGARSQLAELGELVNEALGHQH